MIRDPSGDEMRSYLRSLPFADEFDEFDREEAIYWFANDYHGGQWSNLYSALSTSEYHPGPLTRGCEGSSETLYDELVLEYVSDPR